MFVCITPDLYASLSPCGEMAGSKARGPAPESRSGVPPETETRHRVCSRPVITRLCPSPAHAHPRIAVLSNVIRRASPPSIDDRYRSVTAGLLTRAYATVLLSEEMQGRGSPMGFGGGDEMLCASIASNEATAVCQSS